MTDEHPAVPGQGPASWRTIRRGAPVLAADGSELGIAVEVLGSDTEDLFHGIRLRVPGWTTDLVVPSDDVTEIGLDRVVTSLERLDLAALDPYRETASYHIGQVGWRTKHPGWRRDVEDRDGPR